MPSGPLKGTSPLCIEPDTMIDVHIGKLYNNLYLPIYIYVNVYIFGVFSLIDYHKYFTCTCGGRHLQLAPVVFFQCQLAMAWPFTY